MTEFSYVGGWVEGRLVGHGSGNMSLPEHYSSAVSLILMVLSRIIEHRLTPFPGFTGFLQKFIVYLLPLMVA